MNALETLASRPEVGALGQALLHFVWQGAFVAGALALVLARLDRRGPEARYVACCGAMALMALAPLVTFAVLLATAPHPDLLAAPIALDLPGPGRPAPDGPLLAWLAAGWIAGAVLLQARLALHWWRAGRLTRRGISAVPPRWARAVADLAAGIGVRRPVRVLESSIVRVPTVIGWLRPAILVPSIALTGLTPHQLRAVLAHELAHVRRHDYLVNVLQAVFESLLFYHPAVWWVSRRIREEREYCCDDVAIRVCGDCVGYARALSSLDTLRDGDLTPALASTGGSLMSRIQRIVGAPPAATRAAGPLPAAGLAAVALAAAVTATGLALPLEVLPEGDPPAVETRPVDRIDLPALLEDLGATEAPMMRTLADSGIDDDVLLIIMRRLGVDQHVMEAIEMAARAGTEAERRHIVGAVADMRRREMTDEQIVAHLDGMAEAHVTLSGIAEVLLTDEQGEAGQLVELVFDDGNVVVLRPALALGEDAEPGLYEVHLEAMLDGEQDFTFGPDSAEATFHLQLAKEKLAAVAAEEAEVAAFGEAKRKLHEHLGELHERWTPDTAGLQRRAEVVAAKLARLKVEGAKIAEAIHAGRLAMDDAHPRLDRIHRHLDELAAESDKIAALLDEHVELGELHRAGRDDHAGHEAEIGHLTLEAVPFGEAGHAEAAVVSDRLRAVHEHIMAAMTAGRIDKETAHRKLMHLHRVLEALAPPHPPHDLDLEPVHERHDGHGHDRDRDHD
jgi:Zn-dependent protease with chaperone function